MRIVLPHNFEPRHYQLPALKKLDEGIKRVVCVWHRRAGKEKTFINHTAKAAFKRVGTYFYIFPTYKQAKKAIWDGMDRNGFPFLSHFPSELVDSKNETELKLKLKNGSIFQLVGSDNIDSLMSTNPIGCVFAEYALQDPRAWDYMRPILRENGGWAIFDYTPRGKNHGFALYQMAKNNPDWFAQILTVKDTGALSEADIDAERREGMSEELIQQEYYCSFEGVYQGAYYGKQLQLAEKEGRLTNVPYDPALGVDTWWDLGIGDAMSIWFTQSVGQEIRIINYYENSGEGLPHYAKYLQSLPYVYKDHNAPHDIEVRELGTGRSRLETAKSLGINFKIVPKLGVDDGIEAVRSILARCWFDKVKCERGLNALHSYHKDYDEKGKTWKSYPAHDWSSHAADAFRYFAIGFKKTRVKAEDRHDRHEQAGGWMA